MTGHRQVREMTQMTKMSTDDSKRDEQSNRSPGVFHLTSEGNGSCRKNADMR
jgi:hypothetical protein